MRHGALVWCGWMGWCFASVFSQKAYAEDALTEAYKKEFAFLQAQKKSLQKRLSQLEQTSEQRVRQTKARILQAQGQLLQAQEQVGKLQQALQMAEQSAQKVDEQKEQRDKITERGLLALREGGLAIDENAQKHKTQEALWIEIFRRVSLLLDRQGQIRKEKSPFFLRDGTQDTGDLIHLGQIASFAISPRFEGALAPAGGGQLKVWPQDAATTAQALYKNLRPKELRLFLYENREKEALWKEQQTLYAWLDSGGSIAWVIVWLGAAGALLLLLRLLILGWATIHTPSLLQKVEDRVLRGDIEGALGIVRRCRGPVARGLETTLAHLDKPRSQVEEQFDECMLREAPKIERFGAALGVTAAVAPLLGLLGTVTGMIATFNVLTEQGAGDPKALAGGISEALITTELGLLVAIPALLLGTLLSGYASRLLGQMEWASLHLLNTLHNQATPFPETTIGREDSIDITTSQESSFDVPSKAKPYPPNVYASS